MEEVEKLVYIAVQTELYHSLSVGREQLDGIVVVPLHIDRRSGINFDTGKWDSMNFSQHRHLIAETTKRIKISHPNELTI